MIAPLWRDLDPSKGGSIKYGEGPSGSFVIAWIDVPNKANSNTQTFSIIFYPELGGDLCFVYDSITNDVPTSIGIEDQTGKRGLPIEIDSISPYQRITFEQNSPDNFLRISRIKVSASKLTDSGTNDDNAVIHIDGLDNTLPGGVNVELYDPSEEQYTSFPVVSAACFVLSTAALEMGYGWLGVASYVLSGANLAYQLSPTPSSTVHEADSATETAYILSLAQDEKRPDQYPWDSSVFALLRWRLLSQSLNHRLVLNAQVDYAGETFTLVTDSLELKLTPGDVSWYGRTNPDAHYYNFYQISTPYGTGYHIDTIGSNDYGYHMLGWSKLTDDTPEDYKVGADGKIRVKGYFRQSDTFSSGDQPGRRKVNIYVMHSENLNKIVKTAQVLDYTDGTGWRYKAIIISGLTPGKPVKIGIGRPDSWYADWNLVVEWAGIEVYEGAGSPPNTPSLTGPNSGHKGWSYTYKACATDPDDDSVKYTFYWGDGSNTTTGYYGSGVEVSRSHSWSSTGTYSVQVKATDVYGAYKYSSSLTVNIQESGGSGCPTLFVWNGRDYVDYGVIDIHDVDNDVVREVHVQAEDVSVSGYKVKFTLREGWEGLNFSHSLIDQVKLYAVDSEGNRYLCPLIKAEHSEQGKVLLKLLFSDDYRIDTYLMETIDLTFLVPYPTEAIENFTFILEGHNPLKQ